MNAKEQIIINYLEGYNSFDISKMVMDLADVVVFQNIQKGMLTMELTGLEAFKTQAVASRSYFSKRKQTITSIKQEGEIVEIEVDYVATLAIDLPNGMKSGQELKLKGQSIFEFEKNKIIRLTDIN